MKVVVLGGDGFCGWPTTLHLSARGHEIVVVDNFARRAADLELGASSLTPIETLDVRLAAWKEVSGQRIAHQNFDIAQDYEALAALLEDFKPDAVIHFAEQRSAPYSMRSGAHKRRTVFNNISATHNLLCAMVESGQDIHLIHIGTMGVYGYPGGVLLPEGYLPVEMPSVDGGTISRQILYPTDPGSIYHMTKSIDQLLFQYYNKNDDLRITDLHQGIIWGTNTRETKLDPRLVNRFCYDGDYGTVLNRFLVQAAVGHPLTVHGIGGQTRAFIHIQDTVRCVELALTNQPDQQRVRIFNQIAETHRVGDLAELVSKMTGAQIQHLPNPRNEAASTTLHVEATGLKSLGFKPTLLEESLLVEVVEVARRYADRCDRSKIPSTPLWRRDLAPPSAAEPVAATV